MNVKFKQGFSLVFTAAIILSFCVQPGFSQEIEAITDNKKKAVETSTQTELSKAEFTAAPPKKTSTISTSEWLLYGGGAALGIGILAVAISGTDGGSGPSEPTVPPVGPDIAGSDWQGILNLVDYGAEGVTAVITQVGESITITTSSNLAYGQYYSGHISAGGYITVKDAQTNKTWTTFQGNASTNNIRLYDYVNGNSALDKLFLTR